jgi:asparagine synthase (glutamine-hydrolysing)
MSGIVGIVNLGGAPVEPSLLERLTDFLTFRGPDARRIWLDGHIGFGHTALWTTFDAPRERQPCSLDGQVWITADARIDARADLIEQLAQRCGTSSLPPHVRVPPAGSHGQEPVLIPQPREKDGLATGRDLVAATDVELILLAYHVWGEDCVEHLLGDFAFAIWDGRKHRLFCARDHMGVKPFYYARIGNCVIFSNTLDCIRQHPAVSDKLNDLAIADFLLFGLNQDPFTTAFADIQRLPAAHTATWSNEEVQIRRYWTLPIDQPLRLPRPEDYTGRFRELLQVAVRDRLRTDRIAIFMSGGLDSSAMAAAACDLLRERPGSFSINAFTAVYVRAMPDRERYYAGLVASHLGIPIHFSARDDEILARSDRQLLVDTPEPVYDPSDHAHWVDYQRQVALEGRVLFYGEGPDNALRCDWRAHLASLRRERRYGRMLPDFLWHVFGHPRIPFVGRLTSWLKGYRKTNFPAWFNERFAGRLGLRGRWEEVQSGPPLLHPTRPRGYQAMSISLWQDFLESFDIANAETRSEVRHPYLDIRFIRFLLSVPAIPWCCNKYLSRRALRGVLPHQVIRRPKTPLAKDPSYERARRSGMPQVPVTDELLRYVNPQRVPQRVGKNVEAFRADMRSIGLAYWLRTLGQRKRPTSVEEEIYGTTR